MKTSFFSELLARLSAESPKFFKKLQAFGVWLAALGTGLLVIPGIPQAAVEISGYLITAGGVLKLIASLPVADPDEIANAKPVSRENIVQFNGTSPQPQ